MLSTFLLAAQPFTMKKLTLKEWADQHGIAIQRHEGSRAVCVPTSKNNFDLYDLADYRVTSVTGGSVWLMPRRNPNTN